ncbi:MAG: ATP-binding protein [Bacteroidetes bacterium]|nr:ATP-binding protein [Bacteroidota bacterium]MCL5738071.1 ATP-binding protein [Bacteroidota bacterium]
MYSLFKGLNETEITELLKSAAEETIPAGRTVLTEGAVGTALYILKSGEVEIRKQVGEKEEILGVLKAGDFFGEMAAIDGPPEADQPLAENKNSASAVATRDSTLICFEKKTISSFLVRFPQISWNIARTLSDRLRASNDALKNQIEFQRQNSEKEIARLNSLIEATRTVNSSLEIDRVLQLILNEAMRITDAERGTIYLVDDNTNEIWSRIIVGNEMNEIRQPIGKGISGYVAETGETINIQEAYNDPRFNPEFDLKSGFKTKNILCVPMRNKDNKIIGVFQLINKRKGKFDSEDETFLKAFSIHASIAIENSRLALEMVKTERLSAVGRMAGTIIHDIKNPMSTIRVYAQVLKKKAGSEEAASLVDEITKQIDRLVNMAQEVLDFSRGVSQMNIQKVKFDEFLAGVLWFLQKDFEKRNIELHNENTFAGEVEIDMDKMTRVILNIAGNAADAMPNGGNFFVRSHSDDNTLMIELEDTGSGMPEEIRKKIFEPFVTYGKKHGTGLGMAIVKKIIDDHNGEIEIQSEIGKGTKMILKIPITQKK